MSNQLDGRIRDLYAELAEAAPPLPPLMTPETVLSPWVRGWPVLVAAAAATIVTIAAVPILLGGGLFGTADEASDATSIAAAETTEAPTTTVAAETAPETTAASETTEATTTTTISTGSPFLDAMGSTTVSSRPVDLPAETLLAADGLVVAALVEFELLDDGSTGHENFVIVVDDGAATVILGRYCRVETGPPFADTGGGVIVHGSRPDIGDVRRCTPGEEIEPLADNGVVLTSAVVDGRPTVAVAAEDVETFESVISLVDLDTGATEVLASFDLAVETPIAASYGGGMWMISLLAAEEPFSSGGSTRYSFFDTAGTPITIPGNPAPEFSAATATYRMGALTPDGSELVFVEQFADLAADVVVWDLTTEAEVERYRVIDPFTPADDAGGGQQFVGSLDVSDTAIVVNVNIAFGAVAPGGIVHTDRISGSVSDVISGTEGIDFQVASFLERP